MSSMVARLAAEHDTTLVFISMVVCFLSIGLAISLFHRGKSSSPRDRIKWLGLSALVSGYGIWASAFIAIMAYGKGLEAGYNMEAALASFACAVGFNSLGVYVASGDFDKLKAIIGGTIICLGIILMQVTSVLSLALSGRLTYSLTVLPFLLAAAVAHLVAFIIATKRSDLRSLLIGAIVATFAIAATHFSIISGLNFTPDSSSFLHKATSTDTLSTWITAFAILIISMCVVALSLDHQSKKRLLKQKGLTDSALTTISQGLCMCDPDGYIIMFNQSYTKMTGMDAGMLTGRSLLEVLKIQKERGAFLGDPDIYFGRLKERMGKNEPSSTIIETPKGQVLKIIDHPLKNGGWVATIEDITDWQTAQQKISFMAEHDALTELPNRRLFRERLESALSNVERGNQVAILAIDLDHFKEVNDTLGHPIGDEVLRQVAERLSNTARKGETVARFGGDEFAVVMIGRNVKDYEASILASRLIDVLSVPYLVEDQQIIIGASIGIAVAPTDALAAEQLLQNADIALYRAKSDGRGIFRFYEKGMDAEAQLRRLLMLDLRRAIEQNEFALYFQPILDVRTNEVTCFEALLRWNHPVRGLIPPSEFIPLAEETGLIITIGDWVLKEACKEAATWSQPVSVAVNLSPVQFKNKNLIHSVHEALEASNLSPYRLEFEVTEAILLHDTDENLSMLHQLREMGIRISIDDFGTGYSSLSYLQSFPFDKIKIDQSFVRRLTMNKDAKAIIRAVMSLGKSLGIKTLAEGVETLEQMSALRTEGCVEVQGYLFDKPRPAADVPMMLSKPLKAAS